MRKIVFFLAAIAIAMPGSPQSIERILVPYYVRHPIQGGYGSRWATELAIINTGSTGTVIFRFEQPCPIEPCDTGFTPPGVTFYPVVAFGNALSGFYFRVYDDRTGDIRIHLRARDLSRQADDWGAEVPTLRESSAPVGAFELLDVPTDPGYRVMLRIYTFARTESVEATVRFFATPVLVTDPAAANPDVLLAEEQVTLIGGSEYGPGYAELSAIVERHPILAQSERMRIEVRASDPSVRLWGFATITNNETQHVTVVSAR